ncbi:MAG TPA: radical SAM protein, partial [Actinomycetota bacterium]|nr:radical SAM protein [Actinomycetota bacterium]
GEETLLRLFEAHADSAEPAATVVPGSVRRNPATGVFESAPRALLRLRELPLPAFDKVPLMAYQRRHTPYRAVTFELSRGCTDKCVFCSEWVFWQKIRTAEIGQVVDGIERLQADYGCQVVWFMDSLMNANLHRVGQLAEELLRRGVNVKWGGYLRANIDKPTATLLKRAGCEFVFVGVESLSDETLALMHKRRTGTDNLQALEALLEGGVDRVVAGFIPGFPGDTRGRFMATAMELGRMHQRYPGRFRVNVEPFVVSPRQPLFADLGGNGLVGVPWQESYLDMAGEFRPIVEGVLCSVEGANQGIDRAGELRVAQAVTATAAVGPDPFLYYETEPYSTVELQIGELSGGWYQGVMKGEGGTLYGLILSREDRSEYEALQRESTVGYGFGYGRKPNSPLFARPAFAGFFRRVEAAHLVPPRGRQPEVRTGRYRRQPLRTGDRVALSPFAVARLMTGPLTGGEEPEILVLDLATGGSHRVGAEWEWLLRALIRPARMGTLLHGRADTEQVARQIHDLVEAGVAWGEWNGQIRTQHPTAGRRPLELAAVGPASASGAR